MLGECHMKVDFQIKFQNETKCSHFNKKNFWDIIETWYLKKLMKDLKFNSQFHKS